jgi:hypothetical protein
MTGTALSFLTRSLLLLALATGAAVAQQPTARGSCEGRVIHAIRVSALRPPFKGEAAYWRRVAHSIGLHHITTDTAVVRRFLALQTGGLCTDFRMKESARLLREQPFIADATVRSIPDPLGGVTIEVETVDEIPALVSASLGGHTLTYLEIGNENMFGDAWLLALHGSDRQLEGRSAGFRVTDYQFLGRPYQFDAQADWGQRASGWLVDASHAYLTDLQRVAWETGLARVAQQYIVLQRGDHIDNLALRYRRSAADVGSVFRFGNPRTPFLFGGLLNFNRLDPFGGVAFSGSAVFPDTTLTGRYPAVKRARLAAVGAWRNLNFITVYGFDALTAAEDLPTGFQLFGQLGRGMPMIGGESDVYTLGDILSGVGSAKTYAELHLITEGRRATGAQNWNGIVSTGQLLLYWKPNSYQVVRGWTDYAGGWRLEVPFQLQLSTLGERLIGYHGSLVGARRAGGGLELRQLLPNVTSRADVAAAAFVNSTRLWAGDAPFGVDTPLLPSVGVSALAAVPRGSQKTLRIDLGLALRKGVPRSGWEVRLTFFNTGTRIRSEPSDVSGARELIVGPNVFRP